VNPDILKGSHDIERGWKMLRLYLLLRGNLSDAGELIHVRGLSISAIFASSSGVCSI
jgi:hypothetical protein